MPRSVKYMTPLWHFALFLLFIGLFVVPSMIINRWWFFSKNGKEQGQSSRKREKKSRIRCQCSILQSTRTNRAKPQTDINHAARWERRAIGRASYIFDRAARPGRGRNRALREEILAKLHLRRAATANPSSTLSRPRTLLVKYASLFLSPTCCCLARKESMHAWTRVWTPITGFVLHKLLVPTFMELIN
jgi:hypothetical protein